MIKIHHSVLLILLILVASSCSDFPSDVKFDNQEQSFAIPIINTSLSVKEITDKLSGKASVSLDGEGRVTAVYSGNLIGFNSVSIFPPIPGIVDNVLPDTVSNLPLPIKQGHTIKKAKFKNSNMTFKFRSSISKKYNVTVTIPNVSLNGIQWRQDYVVDFSSGITQVITPGFLLNGWTVVPDQNMIQFIYDARDENGNRVKFDYGAMVVDVLEFASVEGYFGSSPFDIPGDFIDVNLFDTWIRGGLEIDDPRIKLQVENAFGFPVRSKVNKLEFITKSGNIFPLESTYIATGIDFAYPTAQEQGQTKTTYFTFDKTNSNIKQIFNDKIVRVVYDIDAIPNPDFDESVTNFLNDQSFFKVNVDVEIPMHLKANDFVVGDTFNIDLKDFDDAKQATFKTIVTNGFPVDIFLQGYFLNESNQTIDSLFNGAPISLEGPPVGGNGKATTTTSVTTFKELDEVKLDKIRLAKKLVITAGFDNAQSEDIRWIFDEYRIDLKLGAIVKLK